MQIADNAAEALNNSREGVSSVIDWFRTNAAELPIGLAVAGVIVLVMLGTGLCVQRKARSARDGFGQVVNCDRLDGEIDHLLHPAVHSG